MAARQVAAALLALGALALPLAACGEDGAPADDAKDFESFEAMRQEKVERLVRDGTLPPVALRLQDSNGTTNVDFIDGPNGDEDIVRTSDDGASGKKLQWDLDQDGTIEPSERTITERELYDATLGYQ